MPATITVRALTPNWDIRSGNGAQDFLQDGEAVAQIIQSTLLLLQGEFFLNTAVGTPLFQQLLSNPIASSAVALIFQNIILGVPYVTGITSLAVTYQPASRAFSFSAVVTTQFGTIQLQG